MPINVHSEGPEPQDVRLHHYYNEENEYYFRYYGYFRDYIWDHRYYFWDYGSNVVMVFVSGSWVPVADSSGVWSMENSEVTCRQLGFDPKG